ncbi:hypothetical protein CRM22_004963 [Opisthorchis felineus]|uniref:Uncharacterized protein n=1 Tax=Opisthorchis felineus TaxID=147828 RepID=A0A4S2LZ54_OPIFE|nr:hypothetical protein CRM22_004963 [Opisthorchis felineus]
MAENTDFNIRFNLARFIVKYIDYHGCVSRDGHHKHYKVRMLGNLKKTTWVNERCRTEFQSKNLPAVHGLPRWTEMDDCLYLSGGLKRLAAAFYEGGTARKNSSGHVIQVPMGGNRRRSRRSKFISKLSREFFTLITDENFHGLVKQTEDLKRILGYMWCPTRPLENVGQYAIAKHASIHYILSTHAILPSSECFTPDDIQRIMHLPMEWIGALPRQEDTRCITKFIARFADLFAEKSGLADEAEDPLDRHARKCGHRVFMDIIRYASTGKLPIKPPRKVRQTANVDERNVNTADGTNELESYPPLDWNDQLLRTKVKIYDMPECEKTPRTYMPSWRKVKNPCYIQKHGSLVAVNEASIMREVAQTLTALESEKNKSANKVDRYSKSHSLRRAVYTIQCPGLRDRPEKPRHTSIIDQLEKEEKQFDAIVDHLPHRLHDIEKLQAISGRVTAAQPPENYSAEWIIDPTDQLDQKQTALLWNPNRRIYVENEIREQHNSPKCIRALDETRLDKEPPRSQYDVSSTPYGLDPQKRFSRMSLTSRRRSQMPTKLSLARWSVAKTAAGGGQRESNILDDMYTNNANAGLKLPPIATGHRGFPERKPGK